MSPLFCGTVENLTCCLAVLLLCGYHTSHDNCQSVNQTEMAIVTPAEGGGHGCCVGFDLCGEELERFVHGDTVDTRQDFVLKVRVVDTGDAGGRHGRW